MLVIGIPACRQGCVHVTGVSVSRGVHRWACVARVGCGHLWPSGGDWGRMQSWSTAHQTGFHPGCGVIERILVEGKENSIKLKLAWSCIYTRSQFVLS